MALLPTHALGAPRLTSSGCSSMASQRCQLLFQAAQHRSVLDEIDQVDRNIGLLMQADPHDLADRPGLDQQGAGLGQWM